MKTYSYCCAETDPSKSSVTKQVTVDSNSISASNKNGESRQIISVHFGNFEGRYCPRNFWQQRFLPGTPNPVKTAVRMWLERLAVLSPTCSRFLPVNFQCRILTWPYSPLCTIISISVCVCVFGKKSWALAAWSMFGHQNTAHIRSALQDWSGHPRSGKLNILNRCFISPKLETEDRRSKRSKCRFEPCSSKGETFTLSRSSLAKICWFIRSAFEDWFGCSRGREIECGCIGGFFPKNGTLHLLRKRNA